MSPKFRVEEIAPEEAPKIDEPKMVPDPVIEEPKTTKREEKEQGGFVVTPTDNIDMNSKPGDGGAFLKIFLVTFFATLLAFLLAGGIYVYLSQTNKITNSKLLMTNGASTPQPTQAPEVTATPLASPSADVSTFKISVLNGNGGIGVASAAKAIIEKNGFKVTNTGNADSFDFTDTLIQVKPSVSADVAAKLKNALMSNYSVKIGDPLDASDAYDIIVTVGSK